MLHFSRPVIRLGSGVALATALTASMLNTRSVAAASQSPLASTSLSNSTVTTPTLALCGASTSGQVAISTTLSNTSISPSCTPQPGQILVIVIGGNSTNAGNSTAASSVPADANALSGVITPTQNTPPTQLQSTLPNQLQQTGEHADMSNITDPRINTYAKRQAIRDQYRGRINETTFNDELGDGVGLDQALSDALRELNAK